MTVEDEQEEMVPGPSSSGQLDVVTLELDHKYFDCEMCYAPPKAFWKSRIEICKTLLPVLESPMSPPEHEIGTSLDKPLVQPAVSNFHASYHVQDTRSYQNVSEMRYSGCMVYGRSMDAIKTEKTDWYMCRSTPRDGPEHKVRLKREAFENGLNTGCFFS